MSRPVVVTGLVAGASLGLLAVAVGQSWLGPDVGRGAQFCESSAGLLRQPVNALSNLGFVVAGLAIAWQTGRPGGLGRGTLARRPELATAYACVVVLLGPGSMAMHATETAAGGRLDTASMYLVAAFVVAYAAMRRWDRGSGFFAGLYALVFLACELVGELGGALPIVESAGNLAFGTCLLTGLVLEHRFAAHSSVSLDERWGWGALGALVLAFAVWNSAKTGSSLCFPHSLYQGHGVWHVLCACSAWLLFQLYVSERPVDDRASKGVHLTGKPGPGPA